MFSMKKMLPLLICAVSCHSHAISSSTMISDLDSKMMTTRSEPKDILFDQAYYWQTKFRGDLSREALQRILLSDPQDPRALFELGMSYCKDGHIEKSEEVLERLEYFSGNSEDSVELRKMIENMTFNQSLLANARRFQEEKKTPEALKAYEVLLDNIYYDEVYLEYYHTMSSLPNRYAEAVSGLRKLRQQQPNDEDIMLVLAQVLSYQPSHREEALNIFKYLSQKLRYRVQVKESYANTLMWLPQSKETMPLYRDYLIVYPSDSVIKNQLNSALIESKPDDYSYLVEQGYADIKAGQLVDAESHFKQASELKNDKGEPWVGLAIIQQRQGLHDEALKSIDRMLVLEPLLEEKHSSIIKGIRFWHGIDQVSKAEKPDDRLTLISSIQAYTDLEYAALLTVEANELLLLGDVNAAIKSLEHALDYDAKYMPAVRGILDAYITAREYKKLTKIYRKYSSELTTTEDKQLKVSLLRTKGILAVRASEYGQAATAFKQALESNSQAIWVRLDYATLLLKRNEKDKALMVMSDMPITSTNIYDRNLAHAYFFSQQQNWPKVISYLNAMNAPDHVRPNVVALKDMAEFRQAIVDTVTQGSLLGPKNLQKKLLAIYEHSPAVKDRSLHIVNALNKFDLQDSAVAIIEQDLMRMSVLDVATKLNYGNYLLGWNNFDLAEKILLSLGQNNSLNPDQQSDLRKLKIYFLHRQGERAIRNKDYDLAFDYLTKANDIKENNEYILNLLGDVSQQRGEFDVALSYYQQVMALDSRNISALQGAIGSALQADNIVLSKSLLDQALVKMPEERAVYELLAQFAKKIGNVEMALKAQNYARSL